MKPVKPVKRGVPSMDTLLDRLCPCDPLIPLSVIATAVVTLGGGFADEWLAHLASCDDPVGVLADVWAAGVAGAPWLDGYTGPLTDWLVDAPPERTAQLRQAARAFRDVDFAALVERCDGDLLGPLYGLLVAQSSKRGRGQFYTPMGVCLLMGEMTAVEEDKSCVDPCCGAGAMLLGAAKAMRGRGLDPGKVLWAANDIDAVAVALAGVTMTAHGMGPHIWLSVGDGLLLGSGADGDPHRTQPPWWKREAAAIARKTA